MTDKILAAKAALWLAGLALILSGLWMLSIPLALTTAGVVVIVFAAVGLR